MGLSRGHKRRTDPGNRRQSAPQRRRLPIRDKYAQLRVAVADAKDGIAGSDS
jgi:hypothetical protein